MEDLQSILEKINREGVEKADAEAKRIIDDAKAKAAAIVKEAEDAAAKAKADAARDADASARRGEETLRQAANGSPNVEGCTFTALSEIAATLKAQLAAKGEFEVVTDESTGSGFSVRIDGGRVEHSFTGATVAGELARRLRPELAKLVKG